MRALVLVMAALLSLASTGGHGVATGGSSGPPPPTSPPAYSAQPAPPQLADGALEVKYDRFRDMEYVSLGPQILRGRDYRGRAWYASWLLPTRLAGAEPNDARYSFARLIISTMDREPLCDIGHQVAVLANGQRVVIDDVEYAKLPREEGFFESMATSFIIEQLPVPVRSLEISACSQEFALDAAQLGAFDDFLSTAWRRRPH